MASSPPKTKENPESCWLLQYPRPRLSEEIVERYLRSTDDDVDDAAMVRQIKEISGDKVVCETAEGLVSYPLNKLLAPPLYGKVSDILSASSSSTSGGGGA
ncbi:hypothetical protein FOZ61_002432 [Perkinsus olseni]|uniref:Uncharacterized protein n=1 Tax=Perkinsus olseni TaxID=32597 RepID=A0A7J6LUI2_PEROL|nr:hypothetical protein FOZ61_002432 [Perkinsus olseni]KAF4672819.1 hypothetical protein FOL46_008359 [Perkinsus olseni]